jgi:hypothetical protein
MNELFAVAGSELSGLDPALITFLVVAFAICALLVCALWICLPFAVFGIKLKLQMLIDRADLIHRDLEEIKSRLAETAVAAQPSPPSGHHRADV